MHIPLTAVGATAPRERRGRTFLPEGMVPASAWWAWRAILLTFMLICAPVGIPVAAWWLWGLRRRMWRWYVAAAGIVTALATVPLVHGSLVAGITLWRAFLDGKQIGTFTISGGDIHILGLLAGGWLIGTIVGTWMSFTAWHRTPSYRDRPRPKTLLTRHRERALIKALEQGEGDIEGTITFGTDTNTGKAVDLPWADTAGHVLVVGAPGTGKTTSANKVVRAAIRDGMFTAIVDMKGSPSTIDEVRGWCTRWNRPLWVFSLDGPSSYDPFSSGDYSRKADLLMATSEWTEEHYKSRAAEYVAAVFRVLNTLGGIPGVGWLEATQHLLNPHALLQAMSAVDVDHVEYGEIDALVQRAVAQALDDPKALSGLTSRVSKLVDSTLGRWTRPNAASPHIDLRAVWDQGGVAIFSMPTLTHREASKALGNLVVQDLKTLSGALQAEGNRKAGLVFVDEFSELGAHTVTTALAMGRESGVRWMLATQDLGDLATGPDGEAFVQKVLTDTNIKVMHGVGDPRTAERLAELAGTRWGVKERSAVNLSGSAFDLTAGTQSGHGTVDSTLVPVLEPNDVLHQGSGAGGTFILINKPGMYVQTLARTVKDLSTWHIAEGGVPDDERATQHLPTPDVALPPRASVDIGRMLAERASNMRRQRNVAITAETDEEGDIPPALRLRGELHPSNRPRLHELISPPSMLDPEGTPPVAPPPMEPPLVAPLVAPAPVAPPVAPTPPVAPPSPPVAPPPAPAPEDDGWWEVA